MANLLIIFSMFDSLPIHVDAVVVVLRVHNESAPLAPAWWNVGPVVLVQIFAEVPCVSNITLKK